MIVVITGGTGLLGQAARRMLERAGHSVRILSRRQDASFRWDPDRSYIDARVFEGAHAVLHLAGENISGRWTNEKKREIIESRKRSTAILADALSGIKEKPVTVCASAIGYYGDAGKRLCVETDPPGQGFLAETTAAWEEAISSIPSSRSVVFRIGVVLSMQGGALPKMVLPVKMFAGSPLGDGRQILSWIHIEDMARMFALAVDPSFEDCGIRLSGTYNAAAPEPISNHDFTREIARVLRRPFFLPAVPAFVLRTVLGEMSALALDSTKVSAAKILEAGFRFRFASAGQALEDLLAPSAQAS